jgi:hypothetical protein
MSARVRIEAGPVVRAGETVQTGEERVQSRGKGAQDVPGDGEVSQRRRAPAREAAGEAAREGQRAAERREEDFGAVKGEGPFDRGA